MTSKQETDSRTSISTKSGKTKSPVSLQTDVNSPITREDEEVAQYMLNPLPRDMSNVQWIRVSPSTNTENNVNLIPNND